MLKIGVLGAGHLGKIHLRLIQQIDSYELVGFYDPDANKSAEVAEEFNLRAFESVDDLIQHVDVVDVVTPTLSHYDCASKALRNFKHVFIEKPVTNTIEEARKLMDLAHEASVKVQVGHVERFNPAFMNARDYIQHPMFIETHRLAPFNPRGTDVSVVLDLMIHDLDIVLSVVKSNVRSINASGVAVLSDTPDICNARLEFDNGCVANITASRISMKAMRKSRFFQKDAYISVDFLEKESEIIQMQDAPDERDPFNMVIEMGPDKKDKEILFQKPDIHPHNAIQLELSTFAECILNGSTPAVTIDDGYKALEVAYKILDKLAINGH